MFESDQILSFENSNEQGTSFRASVCAEEKDQHGSKMFAQEQWDSDSDVDFENASSRKSRKNGNGKKNYKPHKDGQNLAYYKLSKNDLIHPIPNQKQISTLAPRTAAATTAARTAATILSTAINVENWVELSEKNRLRRVLKGDLPTCSFFAF